MRVVLIGSSTGGPGHILKIIKQLPEYYNACIVIGQHISEPFLPSMVQNFVSSCCLPISICENNLELKPGNIYFAKGEHINQIVSSSSKLMFKILDEKSTTYAPNINRLFSSAAAVSKSFNAILGVLLTGIGDDGAKGLLELKNCGAHTIAESEESAIVYGMPRSAKEISAAIEILHIDAIAKKIAEF